MIGVAIVGAGGFVRSVHLPHLEDEPGAVIRVVANRSGTSARDAAALTDGADATNDWQQAIARDDVELVLVGTRHDSHAEIAAAALRHGKAVFLEKPLGLSRIEIDEVWAAGVPNPRLIIGFNRPFAPLAQALRSELGEGGNSPSHVIYRVNAPLPAEHWLNDPAVGGGRVQGEACHMFDFVNWLCGTPVRVWAAALPTSPALRTPDSVSVTVQYAGGSVASVHYSGAGSPNMPKERIEVLSDGRSWVLDDFRSLSSFGSAGSREQSARRADKGHRALLGRVLGACRGERPYEPGLPAAYMAQSVALAALESIASGAAVEVIVPDRGAATAPPPPTGA